MLRMVDNGEGTEIIVGGMDITGRGAWILTAGGNHITGGGHACQQQGHEYFRWQCTYAMWPHDQREGH